MHGAMRVEENLEGRSDPPHMDLDARLARINHSIGACFEQVVALHPGKIAIERPGARITFADLNMVSNILAGRLLDGNAPSPGRVALLFDNRVAAISAMLGVLKAGHAYVPLDCADPEERVRFILRDCEPCALIADEAHLAQARRLAPADCPILNIDRIGLDSRVPQLPQVPPDASAYLFYTSGSTGQPKGVCQSHRNLLFFVGCYSDVLRIGDADRLSLLFSLSFSASNMHIYSGLLRGATICAYDIRRNGIAALADWLDAERITVLHTVPTVFRRLTKGLGSHRRFRGVRAVDLGGEALFASDVQSFRRHFPEDSRLINHLGATEASVIAQYVVDLRQPHDGNEMLPVGRSPEGVRVSIRRPDGTEADVDEGGEIVISSPFVSPGYWRRPELNAAAFLAAPDQPGWRVYRSGDMGRITPANELVFRGRAGSRVKIRGQSVDLAEVEAALHQCACVTDAAVTTAALAGQQEAEKLVAYVVAASKAGQDPKKIRRELATRLPQYMLPSAYVFLDALPQTATGKIDKKALSNLKPLPVASSDVFDPPKDDVEQHIASVFAQILNYAPVGRADDFFLHGGDSLSVMELHIVLVNTFGNNVPDVFEDTTVAGLAEAIRHRASMPSEDKRLMPVLLPRRKEGAPPILFLVHGRRGQAHVGTHFVELLGPDQPLYVFQARGVDGIQPPNKTIHAMARDYVGAMRAIQLHGPYFLAGLCSGGFVAVRMAQVLRGLGERVGPLLLIDPPVPPFTLEKAINNVRGLGLGLRALQQKGNIDFDFNDPNRRRGARQVAASFENALLEYQPEPYDGPVLLLATREKLTETGWGNRQKLKAHFAGEVQCFEVGQHHTEILDTNNETFARHLTDCVMRAREATRFLDPAERREGAP